ncbi:MAG: hypothetical protein AB9835_11455 [Eubacteriales bacterium]
MSEILQQKYGDKSEINTSQKLYEYLLNKRPNINIPKDKQDLIICDLIINDNSLNDEEKIRIIRETDLNEYLKSPSENIQQTFHPLNEFIVSSLEKFKSYRQRSDIMPLTLKLIKDNEYVNDKEISDKSCDKTEDALFVAPELASIPDMDIRSTEDLFLFFMYCYRAFLPMEGLMIKHDPLY